MNKILCKRFCNSILHIPNESPEDIQFMVIEPKIWFKSLLPACSYYSKYNMNHLTMALSVSERPKNSSIFVGDIS